MEFRVGDKTFDNYEEAKAYEKNIDLVKDLHIVNFNYKFNTQYHSNYYSSVDVIVVGTKDDYLQGYADALLNDLFGAAVRFIYTREGCKPITLYDRVGKTDVDIKTVSSLNLSRAHTKVPNVYFKDEHGKLTLLIYSSNEIAERFNKKENKRSELDKLLYEIFDITL